MQPASKQDILIAAMGLMWKHPRGEQFVPWLQQVKSLGYDGIAGFMNDWSWGCYVDDPRGFRSMTEAHGLELASVDEKVDGDFDRYRKLFEFMSFNHCSNLVLIDKKKGQDIAELAELLNRIGELAREYGIFAHMHNNTDGMAESYEGLEAILAHTDPDKVYGMLDLGHATKDFQTFHPEERATRFLEAHWNRLRFLEFKDWHPETELATCVGAGLCNYPAVFAMIRSKGYQGWITVEQNGPQNGRTSEQCAGISREFIRQGLGA
jgi:sugar phosphate isomerase/epimerase